MRESKNLNRRAPWLAALVLLLMPIACKPGVIKAAKGVRSTTVSGFSRTRSVLPRIEAERVIERMRQINDLIVFIDRYENGDLYNGE